MNISITSRCNRECSFCFQKDWYRNKYEDMTLQNVISILEWANIKKIGILGGEPLLHPNIIEILQECKKRNITIKFMTNLIAKTDTIKTIIEKGLVGFWLINGHYTKEQRDIFLNNLSLFNEESVAFSYTLTPYSDNKKIYSLISEVSNLLNDRDINIRLSPSQPYKEWKIFDYTEDIVYIIENCLSHKRIFFGFDCGINECDISNNVKKILKNFPDIIKLDEFRNCNNDPIFDIMSDNSAVWCNSARFLKLNNIFDYKNFHEARETMINLGKKYWENKKINKKCNECKSYKNQCNGACIAKNEYILKNV